MHYLTLSCVFSLAYLAITALAANTTPCNNSPLLCNRAYDNVTYLGAHDSPFLRDSSTSSSLSGDQFYSSITQLSAGVRLLTGQIYTTNATSGLHLCHTECSLLDAGRLSTWLSSIKTWLDANPNDVVTILLVNSNDAPTSSIAAEFALADLTSYTFHPTSTATSSHSGAGAWPTLQTLINANTRLITFVASLADDGSAAPYLLNEFDYMFENSYNNTSPSDFSCVPDRPANVAGSIQAATTQGLMPLLNHFLYTELATTGELAGVDIPDVDAAYTTNAPTGSVNCTATTGCLGTVAQGCADMYGRAPSYVLVDWFNVGPAIATVDALNGVAEADVVGRQDVSGDAAAPAGGSSSSSSAGSAGATQTTAAGGSAGASGTGGTSASATAVAVAASAACGGGRVPMSYVWLVGLLGALPGWILLG